MTEIVHDKLPCGIEYAVWPLPTRRIVAFQLRILAGTAHEPSDKLGLAHLLEETINKGTAKYDGRQLADEFDAIGAACGGGTGRETTTFTCTMLPEHLERAVELHAEFLGSPTFPEDVFAVNLDLAKQELLNLEDDAQGLADKFSSLQVWGNILGRHPLGEMETLARIKRDDLFRQWQNHFGGGRTLLAAAGAVDPPMVADVFERHFGAFGNGRASGRDAFAAEFAPRSDHHPKELEQEYIIVGFPGVSVTHDDFPVQQVVLGILSGGMSGRLFTEVREKQGLVYWVSAWQDTPRGAGMIFLGASTTPERCARTYQTLLREVDRLAEDIHQDELERAITGILAQRETRGDSTRSRCSELASDLFHFGRPVSIEEKNRKIRAVTIAEVRRYLATYPRDRLCVTTLGPKPLGNGAVP